MNSHYCEMARQACAEELGRVIAREAVNWKEAVAISNEAAANKAKRRMEIAGDRLNVMHDINRNYRDSKRVMSDGRDMVAWLQDKDAP